MMNNNIVIPNRDNGEYIFKKSSKIQRSPERTVVSMINASTHGKENPSSFDKLGVKIEKLVEFLKGRNNIHKEIASLSKEIQAIYMITKQDGSNRVAPPSSTIAKKIFASQETQTEKLFVAQANKRKNSERSSNAKTMKNFLLRSVTKLISHQKRTKRRSEMIFQKLKSA